MKKSKVSQAGLVIKIIVSVLIVSCFILVNPGNVTSAYAKSKPVLSVKKVTLNPGKSKKLVLKNKKSSVTWKSSRKSVASVTKSGIVKARKAGKTTITAISAKKKYKCKVTVKNKASKSNDTSNTDVTTSSAVSTATVASITVSPGALSSVHYGEGTYYTGGYTAGAAGLTSMIADKTINGSTLYICALNKADYLSGLQGAYLRVTGPNGSVDVLVVDEEPGGDVGDIDLDEAAFTQIAAKSAGRVKITWNIIAYPTTSPIQYLFKSGSSKYWSQVQVRNHRYPIVSLEYLDSSGNYKTLSKESYNYFNTSVMGAGPATFRVTDILGHTLIDTVNLNSTGTVINGTANFPY